eukprot:7122328-Prymnesium_polylepis.1
MPRADIGCVRRRRISTTERACPLCSADFCCRAPPTRPRCMMLGFLSVSSHCLLGFLSVSSVRRPAQMCPYPHTTS